QRGADQQQNQPQAFARQAPGMAQLLVHLAARAAQQRGRGRTIGSFHGQAAMRAEARLTARPAKSSKKQNPAHRSIRGVRVAARKASWRAGGGVQPRFLAAKSQLTRAQKFSRYLGRALRVSM